MRVLVISEYDDNLNAVRPEGALFIGLHQAGVEVQVEIYIGVQTVTERIINCLNIIEIEVEVGVGVEEVVVPYVIVPEGAGAGVEAEVDLGLP